MKYVRMSRLIQMAELNYNVVYGKAFGLTWFKKGREHRSPELSSALDDLLNWKIVFKYGNNAYKLTGDMRVSFCDEWHYPLDAYLQSYYRRCHPRHIDKHLNLLLKKTVMPYPEIKG